MTMAATSAPPVTVRFELPMPYDVDSLFGFLAPRAVAGIEAVVGRIYSRTIRLSGGPGEIRLRFGDDSVEAELRLTDPADADAVVERCRWLLDLETDVRAVEAHLAKTPHLAASIIAHPGLRLPGQVDGFEVAVRAVVGQQISVAGARTILGRLVRTHGDVVVGEALDGEPALTHLFPSPEVMAEVDPETLPMPRSRGRALVAVAGAVASGELVLDRGVDSEEARRYLLALPGIGSWTADYIALRAWGDPDVFLATDLGVRHGLTRMGLADAGPEIFQAWAPWRSYAMMHVWKQLDEEAW
jgi:AraC family transcriptional regulator, regulatory protein of adaptative response / DNA-3-methyladenine glycosylase II